MLQALRDQQAEANAVLESLGDSSIPISFQNDALALQAARSAVALYDRSHWGLIQVSGDDRIRYLHNQSTNDFFSRKPGEGCDTVFVTSTARTLDLATAYILDSAVWLLVSPTRRQSLLDWLDRYIFGADRVELADLTGQVAVFNLIGPESAALLAQLTADALPTAPDGTHQSQAFAGIEGRVAIGTGLALPGYTLLVPASEAAMLWSKLVAGGAVALGEQAWEQLRIEQGRPAPDRELTEDYNPLEAGLWQTISFSKGCYIGQETIARLNTYQGVKQQLWGIRLTHPAPVGSLLIRDQEKVGKLTSVVETSEGPIGLAYVRTKAGGAGLTVEIIPESDSPVCATGEVIDVSFLTRTPQ